MARDGKQMSSHKDAFWRANNPCWICRVSAGTAKASIVAQNEELLVLISPMPLTPATPWLFHVVTSATSTSFRMNWQSMTSPRA